MKIALFALFTFASAANACPKCRPLVEAGVFNASFTPNFLLMALPLAFVGILGMALYFADSLALRLRGRS